jgi:muramoyltetrapeptide carboxypeptidase LdcA involved in peptidoglycan recycling
MGMIKPERLRRGDTVAAISLSSGAAAAFPRRYEAGKRQLEETFGLNVVETPNALKDNDWLYANPQARAGDLHWALTNPHVKGIISTIGGDESVRILPYIDQDLIRKHPKIFMGFSDATVTLTAFLTAGMVAFHGPAMLTDLAENGGIHPFVERSIRKVLFAGEAPALEEADAWTEEFLDWADPSLQRRRRAFIPSEGWAWLQGKTRAEGRLIGSNIEVLEFL